MLVQGILLGISLSFLIGPLLFAIVEAGIGQGFRAGIAVAAGIWTSDVLYVIVTLFGLEAMEAIVALPGFKMWAGLAGGLLLAAFGLGSMLKTRMRGSVGHPVPLKPKTHGAWWLRGFLLNTINPGTIFFWLGITSAVVVPSGWTQGEMLVFFGGMLATLIVTDTLKAWAAKGLRRFLTPAHTRQVQRAIGLLMIVFGGVLALRSVIS